MSKSSKRSVSTSPHFETPSFDFPHENTEDFIPSPELLEEAKGALDPTPVTPPLFEESASEPPPAPQIHPVLLDPFDCPKDDGDHDAPCTD